MSKLASHIQPDSPPAKGEYPEGGRGYFSSFQKETDSSVDSDYSNQQDRKNNLPQLRSFRRDLRKQMTPAEAKLWTHLKNAQLEGRKFRRQHSVDRYILDFYCPQERLAIELDGEVHSFVCAQEYDLERDAFLNAFGIKVLRFENKMVFRDTEAVLIEIARHFGWYLESGKAE